MTMHMMSDKELKRLDTIKRLQEKALTRAQVAELLGLSEFHDVPVAVETLRSWMIAGAPC